MLSRKALCCKWKASASGGAAGLQTQMRASNALGSVRLRLPSAGKCFGGALQFGCFAVETFSPSCEQVRPRTFIVPEHAPAALQAGPSNACGFQCEDCC